MCNTNKFWYLIISLPITCILYIYTAVLDYQPTTDLLVFSGGVLVRCVSVTISPDNIVEGNEAFTVSLGSDDVVVMFNQSDANVTIVDSDECKHTKCIYLYSMYAYLAERK